MLKIINPVNTYRQPLSRKMKKKKSKIGLFVMFAVRILGIYQNTNIFATNMQYKTVIQMYGIPVYDKT